MKSNERQNRRAGLGDLIEALRHVDTDIAGSRDVLLLRLQEAEAELKQERDNLDRLSQERIKELEKANARLSLELSRLRQELTELKKLCRRLVQAQENERRKIARELHDLVGQQLTILSLLLDRALRPAEKAPVALISEARGVVHELIGQVRRLSLDLRPSMLDDLGLVPTLLWYFESYTKETKVSVEFHHSNVPAALPEELSTCVYRVIQESLGNLAPQAPVDRVAVDIRVQDDVLFVKVRGPGFQARSPGKPGGLKGFQECVYILGGKVTIESPPGEGTCLIARLPISADTTTE